MDFKIDDPNDRRWACTSEGHPTPEEMEEGARRQRESVALWFWNDDYWEGEALLRPIMNEAKRELLRKMPWLRNEKLDAP